MSIQSNNEIVIECREADSDKKRDVNPEDLGVYTVDLTNPVTISEGSEVYVRNAFVDTASTSDGKIVVPEDTTLTIGFGTYFVNFNETFDGLGANVRRDYQVGNNSPGCLDGGLYVRCGYTANQPVDRRILNYIRVFKGSINRAVKAGGVSGTFRYDDIDGKENQVPFNVPEWKIADQAWYDVNMSSHKLSVKFDDPTKFGIDVDSKKWNRADTSTHVQFFFEAVPPTADPMFGVHNSYYDILIPQNLKGYDPDQIGRLISDNLSESLKEHMTAVNPAGNDFLTTSHDLVGDNIDTSFFVRADGGQICNFKVGSVNQYIGASQIDFHYDQEAEKFCIGALHTPYYFGANMGLEVMTNGAGTSFLVDSAGGAFITGLSSKVPSSNMIPGASGNFWYENLGFDPSVIPTLKYINATRGVFHNATVCTYDFIKGVNTTSNYSGLDYNIHKPASDTLAERITLMDVPALDAINGTTATTNQIFCKKVFGESQASSGYFLIEADLGLYNEFVGQNLTSTKIKGIVNRYYNSNSYTSGGSEISIPYIHKGLPVQINSIRCRILNPDLQPANKEGGIGADNTIFISIRQNPNPTNQLPSESRRS